MAKIGRTAISDFDLKRPEVKVGYFACFLLAIVLACFMIYPLVWTFMGALKTPKEVYLIPPRLLPEHANWINFPAAWKAFSFPRFTFNTFVLFAGIVLFKFPITCMAAYAFSFFADTGAARVFLGFYDDPYGPRDGLYDPELSHLVPVTDLRGQSSQYLLGFLVAGRGRCFCYPSS